MIPVCFKDCLLLLTYDKFTDAQICNAKMALFSVLKLDGLDAVWSVLPEKRKRETEIERQKERERERGKNAEIAGGWSNEQKSGRESYGKGKM